MRDAFVIKHVVAIIATGLCLALGACATDYLSLASKSIEEDQLEAAVEYLEKGSSEGDERCDYQLALLMLSGKIDGDSESAIRLLHRAANAGLPGAQFDLGLLYEKGEGVRRDPAEAAGWYRKAAEAGLPTAQTNLGLLYSVGRGVEKDPESAVDWFRKAAKGGDPMGQAALGAASFHGAGTEKDVVEGYVWTALAARQGDKGARSTLPEMAREMTERDLEKARYEVRKYIDSESQSGKSRLRTKKNTQYDARDSARQRLHRQRPPPTP